MKRLNLLCIAACLAIWAVTFIAIDRLNERDWGASAHVVEDFE